MLNNRELLIYITGIKTAPTDKETKAQGGQSNLPKVTQFVNRSARPQSQVVQQSPCLNHKDILSPVNVPHHVTRNSEQPRGWICNTKDVTKSQWIHEWRTRANNSFGRKCGLFAKPVLARSLCDPPSR